MFFGVTYTNLFPLCFSPEFLLFVFLRSTVQGWARACKPTLYCGHFLLNAKLQTVGPPSLKEGNPKDGTLVGGPKPRKRSVCLGCSNTRFVAAVWGGPGHTKPRKRSVCLGRSNTRFVADVQNSETTPGCAPLKTR